MRIIKNTLYAGIVVMIFMAGMIHPGYLHSETMKVGYFQLEPNAMKIDGKSRGAICDYLENYIAPEMKVTIEWVGPLPPVRLLTMLEQGQLNAIALLAKNKERETKYDYPAEPFTYASSGIAVLKTNPIETLKNLDELKGYKIAFFAKGFIHPVMNGHDIDWDLSLSTDWQKKGFVRLMGNRVNAVYDADVISLKYLAKINGYESSVKILSIPGSKTGLYTVFAKNDNRTYLAKYEKALKEVSKKKTYTDILQIYLK